MFEQTAEPKVLTIKHVFNAPPERVFRAWTEPALLMQWFRAAPNFKTIIAEVDLKVGGRYRLGMQPPESDLTHIAVGEYQAIKPNEQLVFTWAWEGAEDDQTLVTIDFLPSGGNTEVVLTHENFKTDEARESHGEGWRGCLAALEEFILS
ncbi:MAG: SRPBCC domain-containing protein [Anaerolineales bacterium]|nr:SRPBCC domain-containing protein [Anaerolineales bacterium]